MKFDGIDRLESTLLALGELTLDVVQSEIEADGVIVELGGTVTPQLIEIL